jgi:hypothetical protein
MKESEQVLKFRSENKKGTDQHEHETQSENGAPENRAARTL